MFRTMSTSRAPSSTARSASKAFVSVAELPCGKPTTVDTNTSEPSNSSTAKATSAGRTVAERELDTVADELEVELRSQERVVDRLRDLLIAEVRHRRLGHRARIAA